MAIGNALSVGLIGLKAFTIQLQAFISPGLPYFSIIGLPDASLSEARERVKSGCAASGFPWPQTRVTVNMSPASLPKRGSSHDLAIAAAVLSASGVIPHECMLDVVVLGEVNLDGSVHGIDGLLPILLHARDAGLRHVVVPRANRDEAELVEGVEPRYVSHVGELMEMFGAHATYALRDEAPGIADGRADLGATAPPVGDMAEVVGQRPAKRALEVAAAGGHHVLMVGPPGTGKTMLASRMPGIMAPLDERAQFEVASIRSLCGTLGAHGITDVPPFEAPHHTATVPALVGGGSGIGKPGAVTRAHRGVLFMDEAPEFAPRALQTLREPLESGVVAVSRSKGTTVYPASFQLVMAANPCPCGYGYGTGERCTCRERDRIRYFARLSGPILDRIDIQVPVNPIARIGAAPAERGETSEAVRARVVAARDVARARFAGNGWSCNAQASGAWLRAHTPPAALDVVNEALGAQRLSLRGADRSMRLAWTLADLAGHGRPDARDMTEAIALRTKELT